MKFTLRQLQVFLAVAETNNVSHAAKQLNLSQPAASSALAELENQFSIQLFDRIGKRLQLNESGQSLRAEARALLDQAEQLEQHFQSNAVAGPIKVGATLTIGNYLVVPLMVDYMNRFPSSPVELDVENTRQIADKVLNFELDIGLVEGDIQHPDLHLEPWRDDELLVFSAPDHPLAKQSELSDHDIVNATWILREQGSGTRQAFDRAMHNLLPRLNVRMQLQHSEAIKQAVKSGLGIGCLSRIALQESFDNGSLVPLKTPQLNFQRQFYFLSHKKKFFGSGVRQWLDYCRACG